MRNALQAVVWGVVLAASLASGQERTAPPGEVPRPTPDTGGVIRRDKAEPLGHGCYAEYWYGDDPSRRVLILGKQSARQEDLRAATSLGRTRCRHGFVCTCGGGPQKPPEHLASSREEAAGREGTQGLGVAGGSRCRWPCLCVPGGRDTQSPLAGGEEARTGQEPAAHSPLFLKLGPEAIATVQTQAGPPRESLTLTGPSEIPLDEAAVDLSSLEVRCKPKQKPRSGRRPK
jgi:hypothetical protein